MITISGLDNTSMTVRSVTVSTTMTQNDYVILADPASGAITVTLLAVAAIQPGRPLTVRTTGTTNAVTIDGAGAETIDGAATLVLAAGAAPSARTIVSDGTAWFSISELD